MCKYAATFGLFVFVGKLLLKSQELHKMCKHYFICGRGAKIAINMSVYLSIFPLTYLKNLTTKFYQIFSECYL